MVSETRARRVGVTVSDLYYRNCLLLLLLIIFLLILFAASVTERHSSFVGE